MTGPVGDPGFRVTKNGLYPPLVYNLSHAPCLKIDMRCWVCLAEARSDMIAELAHAMLLLWKSLVTIKRKSKLKLEYAKTTKVFLRTSLPNK